MLVRGIRKVYEAAHVLREHAWLGYAFAVVTSAAAMYVRVLLSGVLEGFPFITFFAAIVVTAFVFGWRAGALCGVLGGIIAGYFLLPPNWTLTTHYGMSNWIGMTFYVVLTSVILLLTAAMHRGFAEYALDVEHRRRLNDELEARVAERTAELEAANQQLRSEADFRERAEAQVRQMQKMEAVGQLTGGIAHDFNNMLAIIVGSLDMAKKYFERDPAKAAKAIDHAMEGARRAAELTARLLAFSRQQPLDPKPVDVNKLVGNMSEMLTRTLGGNIRLETVLAGGLWRMFADPPQLESAILNLCVNGRDAMDGGGKITLETMNAHLDDNYAASHAEVRPGQYVAIAVTDTGTGMTADVISRAFDPFFTTKKPGKGTGLGLSQVYGFAKQSGGHVKIYSEVGQGTTVKLYLPRYAGDETDSAPALSLDRPVEGKPTEIIMVVEDEDGVRQMSVQMLRDLGYTVIQASIAKQALAMLDSAPSFDLLFTDVVMPDMNGKQLADLMKQQRPGLKVLYTTGYTRNAVIHNGMLDRDVSFLPKPFTIQQLATKVRQVLDQR
jgi:signal transduction histidine kinase/CheY-like chemotaxis protein